MPHGFHRRLTTPLDGALGTLGLCGFIWHLHPRDNTWRQQNRGHLCDQKVGEEPRIALGGQLTPSQFLFPSPLLKQQQNGIKQYSQNNDCNPIRHIQIYRKTQTHRTAMKKLQNRAISSTRVLSAHPQRLRHRTCVEDCVAYPLPLDRWCKNSFSWRPLQPEPTPLSQLPARPLAGGCEQCAPLQAALPPHRLCPCVCSDLARASRRHG